MFNKKLKEGLALVTSDIFEFHRWFAGIKDRLNILEVQLKTFASYDIMYRGRFRTMFNRLEEQTAQIEALRAELAQLKQSHTYDHSQLKAYTIDQVNRLWQDKVGYDAWEMLINSHREVLARMEYDIARLIKQDDYLAEYISELQKPKMNEMWLVEYNGHELKGFIINYDDYHIHFLPHPQAPVKAVKLTEVKPIRQL